MQRRDFIRRAGLLLGAAPAVGTFPTITAQKYDVPGLFDPTNWASVRDQFPLTRSRIHMASFLLVSHPKQVSDAIERHRRAFDEDPATYWHDHFMTAEPEVQAAAGKYLEADPAYIALTDSTTMGLGLVYGALRLKPDQEILTTTHDHYSTIEALRYRAERSGARVREIPLYDDPTKASMDQVVTRLHDAITGQTRVLAVIWVHSSTGVKLPLADIAGVIREVNASRDVNDRVLFCVDGVHGFGIDDVTMDGLGCDFFIAGTHKWIFGPRGTGIICGRPDAWKALDPIIPNFGPSVGVWLGQLPPDTPLMTPGSIHSPGGFHSFEYRWALGEAFRFHLDIGKARIQERIHALNTMAKEALAEMAHVRLHTPVSPAPSAGIISFEVDGYTPEEVVASLLKSGIIASTSPYRVSYARLAPSLMNDEDEVRRTTAAIGALA